MAATITGAGYTAFVIEMTSQTWRAAGEVDRTAWTHWLTIIKPAEVRHRKALLYVTAGSNNSAAPKSPDDNLVRVPGRVLSPAGRARVAQRKLELQQFLYNLRRESDNLGNL